MSKNYLMECPFKGCKGKINVVKHMRDTINGLKGKGANLAFDTLVCPKCNNIVGSINLQPSPWMTLPSKKGKPATYNVLNTKTKKSIPTAKNDINKYLKSWAVWSRLRPGK